MSDVLDLKPKVETMKPEDALGFVTVIGKNLPEACGMLNLMSCDGRKDVKIHQTLVSAGRIQGMTEIHILAEVRLRVENPTVGALMTVSEGPTPA